MIERSGDLLQVTAPMVMANANALLNAGLSAFQGKTQVVDLSRVTEADSSALAVMFAWLRHGAKAGLELKFTGLPPGLNSLADLYDVTDLLPLA